MRDVSKIDTPRFGDRPTRRAGLPRVIEARRRLDALRSTGRAWVNGREVGGTDPRVAHLSALYD
jgi:hypothetical protein